MYLDTPTKVGYAASMLASMTAFEVLVLCLVVCSLGAIAGAAGGLGVRLQLTARLDRTEGLLMQILNRSKGQAGAQKMQAQRGLMARAEDQAAQLWAAMHARSPTPAIRTEEDIMRLARDKGLIMSGGGEGEKS